MATNSLIAPGFTRYELAPKSKARSTSSVRFEALSTITGMRLNSGCVRSHFNTSNPSFCGMFKSSNMTAGNGNLLRSL